jgi:acyl-coenzyme A thioesterase PaaI-like protein
MAGASKHICFKLHTNKRLSTFNMSSSNQGFYSKFAVSPRVFRLLMNCWPPFWGMRIHILHIADDWTKLRMQMKLSFYNKNYVGSHFGGALFAMTDPFYMLMLMNLLGRDYVVWDKAAAINFVTPGRTTVTADFHVTEAMLADIKANTANSEKYEPTYRIDVCDTAGKVVARIDKTLYIRRKPRGLS